MTNTLVIKYDQLTDEQLTDIRGGGKKAGSAVMGALSGIAQGAPYGPYGMLFGAVYGSVLGVVFSR